MARINIEDSLWSDVRFLQLVVSLKDSCRAVGAVVLAWRAAQKYWCPDKKPIPEIEFIRAGIPQELIDCGLAERVSGGIYLRGSEEHFAWWFERQRAAKKGGRRSAESRKKTHGTAQPQKTQSPRTKLEPQFDISRTKPEPNSTSGFDSAEPSSSYSSSYSKKEEESQLALARPPDLVAIWNENADPALPRVKALGRRRLGKWKSRWRENPDLNYWLVVIQRINDSRFCRGDNDRHWRASVDFLVAEDSHTKVLEGKYDDPKVTKTGMKGLDFGSLND